MNSKIIILLLVIVQKFCRTSSSLEKRKRQVNPSESAFAPFLKKTKKEESVVGDLTWQKSTNNEKESLVSSEILEDSYILNEKLFDYKKFLNDVKDDSTLCLLKSIILGLDDDMFSKKKSDSKSFKKQDLRINTPLTTDFITAENSQNKLITTPSNLQSLILCKKDLLHKEESEKTLYELIEWYIERSEKESNVQEQKSLLQESTPKELSLKTFFEQFQRTENIEEQIEQSVVKNPQDNVQNNCNESLTSKDLINVDVTTPIQSFIIETDNLFASEIQSKSQEVKQKKLLNKTPLSKNKLDLDLPGEINNYKDTKTIEINSILGTSWKQTKEYTQKQIDYTLYLHNFL